MKLEMDLRGTAAPSKSIVGHVSGPQVDSFTLDIRRELDGVDDETRQEALLAVRAVVQARKRPVVVDAMLLTEGDDANVS